MARIFAVTTPRVLETKLMTYEFLFQGGIPKPTSACNIWGLLKYEANRWSVHIFKVEGFVVQGGVDDDPSETTGLEFFLKDKVKKHGDIALLMDRTIFERFETACKKVEIEVIAHHHPTELRTSYH